jgi:hypothetical protein
MDRARAYRGSAAAASPRWLWMMARLEAASATAVVSLASLDWRLKSQVFYNFFWHSESRSASGGRPGPPQLLIPVGCTERWATRTPRAAVRCAPAPATTDPLGRPTSPGWSSRRAGQRRRRRRRAAAVKRAAPGAAAAGCASWAGAPKLACDRRSDRSSAPAPAGAAGQTDAPAAATAVAEAEAAAAAAASAAFTRAAAASATASASFARSCCCCGV